jgi:hypothetical protein
MDILLSRIGVVGQGLPGVGGPGDMGGGIAPAGGSIVGKVKALLLKWKWILIAIVVIVLIGMLFSFISGKGQAVGDLIAPGSPGDVVEPAINCSDSDGGNLASIKGSCSDNWTAADDYCLDVEKLVEYSCVDNRCSFTQIKCSTFGMGCLNGTCKGNATVGGNETNKTGNVTGQGGNATANFTGDYPDLIVMSLNKYVANRTDLEYVENQTGNVTNGTGNVTNETFINRSITIFLDAAIKNNGNVPSPNTYVKFYITATDFEEEDLQIASHMYLDEMKLVSTSFRLLNVSATYSITVTVDPGDKIKENNEDNNVIQTTVYVP